MDPVNPAAPKPKVEKPKSIDMKTLEDPKLLGNLIQELNQMPARSRADMVTIIAMSNQIQQAAKVNPKVAKALEEIERKPQIATALQNKERELLNAVASKDVKAIARLNQEIARLRSTIDTGPQKLFQKAALLENALREDREIGRTIRDLSKGA